MAKVFSIGDFPLKHSSRNVARINSKGFDVQNEELLKLITEHGGSEEVFSRCYYSITKITDKVSI